MNTRPALERFCEKVKVIPNGCWIWQGNKSKRGYGTFHYGDGKRSKPAHRWGYEHYIGAIPEGLHMDHFYCRTPSCVNPKHLEPVTPAENNRRRWAWELENRNPNLCKNGHDISFSENTYNYRKNRICKICHDMWSRPSRESKSATNKAKTALKPRYKTPMKTYCKRGHLLAGENIQSNGGDGKRTCRACYLERQRFSTLKRRHPKIYQGLYGSLEVKECLEIGHSYNSSSYQKHLHSSTLGEL